MPLRSIDPFTGEVIQAFEEHSAAEVERRLDLSVKAFKSWRLSSFCDRRRLMEVLAAALERDIKAYSTLIAREMGKPISQSASEVKKCAWVCRYYAENAQVFLRDEVIGASAGSSYVRNDPLGTVLAVMPWNFPFWQVFRFAAPTVMAGNAVLLKHASNVCGCSLAIEDLFARAGFPTGLFQSLIVPSGRVDDIVRDDRVHGVSLTGSELAGSSVARSAGSAVKKAVLELGGSNAFIVLADADIDAAAEAGAASACVNSGQSCLAAKRFMVEREVMDAFTDRFCGNMKAMRLGDPLREDTDVGPLARLDIRDEVDRQVRALLNRGAVCRTGGAPLERKGFFYPPTVTTLNSVTMSACDEEVFGPFAAVTVAESAEAATKIANDSRYGLAASVWTRNRLEHMALARDLEVGAVFFNGIMRSDPRLPFGGVKKSGYGRELGNHGIKEFVNVKTVVVEA